MTRMHLIAGVCGLWFASNARLAQADSEKQQCAAAFEDGQRFQIAGDLQRAIAEFESCRVSSCPTAAQRECSRLSEAAQAVAPSIRFELTFGAGLSRRPVMLSIDEGAPAAYDGEAVRVNPGKHRFVFGCEGCATVTRTIALVEQDSKLKEVALKPACMNEDATTPEGAPASDVNAASCLPAATSSAVVTRSKLPEPAPKRSEDSNADEPPLRDIVIFGSTAALATAGSIGFIGFGLEARSGERALAECTPDCSRARISQVKRNYWLANVSLGTGLLALGGATIWWFGLRPAAQTTPTGGKWSVELGPINTLTRTF